MHWLTRGFVCERLRLKPWASYRMVRSSNKAMVSSQDVIDLLNSSRRGDEPEVDFIPSDIVTAEEAESLSGIPSRKLKAWTRTRRRTIPHYRINKQTTRFRMSSVQRWMEGAR